MSPITNTHLAPIALLRDDRPTAPMRKLIIQIPCYNEAASLPVTLADLPRKLDGIDRVEWLVVDDGSTDGTADVARASGVDHVVALPRNQGLARAFIAALRASVAAGADIIVNTDADNQYNAADIPALIAPILAGRAEIVVGARPISTIREFSFIKKQLQRLGSWAVRVASRTDIPDAPSGFRAMTREAAMRLNVFTEYTYTIETIIQAGQKQMAITSVPIRTNAELRPSRLVRSIPSYVTRSLLTILRIFITYRPFRVFVIPALFFGLAGFGLGVRYLVYAAQGEGGGHIQSLILASLLMGASFVLFTAGVLADLISVNRKLLEKLDWRVSEIEDRLDGRG
jgi:glycosyltransferase involved in cell wall biosynthesis